jgi:hypothetical protein
MAWPDDLPAELTVEHDGKQVPLRDTPLVKESPDLSTFAKRAWDAHREVGTRIPIKAETPAAKEAWKREHLPKLYTAGILEAPPGKPEDYAIARPEKLPEGLEWSDELAGKLAKTFHKYGIPKAAVGELMDIHIEGVLGAAQTLQTGFDAGMAELKKEHGDKLEERMELAKRLNAKIFKTPEELEFFNRLGLGDHPGFLSVLLRLAPYAQQDSSLVDGTTSGGKMSGDDVRKEVADIMSNTQNPKHKLYWSRDPATLKYVEDLYSKAYGDAKLELSGGIAVEGKK